MQVLVHKIWRLIDEGLTSHSKHFGHVLPSQSLGIVLMKQNLGIIIRMGFEHVIKALNNQMSQIYISYKSV